MGFDKETQQEPILTENELGINEKISWIYLLIIACPIMLFSLILAIVSSATPMIFLKEGWQIGMYLALVPLLGLFGGVILKQDEKQKSFGYAILFWMIFMGFIFSGIASISEISTGSPAIQVLIVFIGGILYGGFFGFGVGIFTVLMSLLAHWIVGLIKR